MNKGRPRRIGGGAAALLLVMLAVVALSAGPASSSSGVAGSTADATRATARFHDLAVAREAGYGLLKDKNGVACIDMAQMPEMGAMGFHYAKQSLVADGTLDVSRPEALVYAPSAGTRSLAAVEYLVLKGAWDAKHVSPPSLFGHPFNLTPAGNRFGLPAFYSLHAWIWKDNPAGMFAMWNPEVKC
jgi:hypothetical protein